MRASRALPGGRLDAHGDNLISIRILGEVSKVLVR
jgi:hypothetical protein